MEVEQEHEINLSDLPESCISAILSFTTPRDVCRLAAVSKVFRSAAYDDSLWNIFIPHIQLPTPDTPVLAFPSKRDLYFHLCDSILIDGGTKRFWLERSTGKIGYMLSARHLDVVWGEDQCCWRWIARDDSRFGFALHLSDSKDSSAFNWSKPSNKRYVVLMDCGFRFEELLELLGVCWLDLGGEMDCALLSADTEYRVVFVLKFGQRSRGWSRRPIRFSVTTPWEENIESKVVLIKRHGGRLRIHGGGWMEIVSDDEWMEGWAEVVAGEFTATADSPHIRFAMKEVKSDQWKRGLLIDGVRIEPKHT